jgi:hypothetical protein
MTLIKRLTLITLFSVLLLSACGGAAETPVGPDAAMTAGIGTMVASFFGTQTAMVPPVTQTPIPTLTSLPTITPIAATPLPPPTFPPLPTATFIYYSPTPGTSLIAIGTGTFVTSTPNPGSLAAGCNNLRLVSDVTIESGEVLAPEENFDKIWKVENNGTCDWVYQYSLVFTGGEDMGAGSFKLRKVVAPGNWTELTVNMDAPKKEGTYTSYWRMADADGNLFGATLVVSIKVKK